jgi:formylglycine-generating enzyme required for sulfatase activity
VNPNPPEFPSEWSNSYGQDRFGLWQGLELNGVRQVMRWIPPARFMMGSPDDEPGRFNDEAQHEVTISKGFWLADSACSQGLWQAVMNDNPSKFKEGSEFPVETISWKNCQQFIEQANALLDNQFTLRLPTEAEWEYAARAGTNSAFWWGDSISSEQANYNGTAIYRGEKPSEYRKSTVEVLSFEPNQLGLFQVHGNVREWCQDWYGEYSDEPVTDPQGPARGQDRVLRGGGWFGGPRRLRAANRNHFSPGYRNDNVGFRLAGG